MRVLPWRGFFSSFGYALVTVVVLAGAVALVAPQFITTEALDTDVYVRSARNLLTRPEHLYTESYPIRPFTYPPFAAVLFTGFLAVPVGWRTAALTGLSVVALYFVVHAVARYVVLPRYVGVKKWLRLLAVPVTLLTLGLEPVFRNIAAGQMNLVLLPLTFFAVLTAPVGIAGVLVGLAAGIKITPALFGAWFLVRRQWANVWACIGAFAITVLVGAVAAPHSSWVYWSGVFIDDARVGAPAFVYNQSLKGALLRWWGPDLPTTMWLAAVLGALILGTWALWGARAEPLVGFSVIALTGVLVSPISWSHHWVIILPTFGALWIGVRTCSRWSAAQLIGGLLCGLWLVGLATHLVWSGDFGNDAEYHQSTVIKVAQSTYTILGVTTLTWFAIMRPRTTQKASSSVRFESERA